MHPTPHTTIHRRAPAQGSTSHANGIEITDDDILDAIEQIASKQSTCYVRICTLAFSLGLEPGQDRDWLIGTLKVLDTAGTIVLSPLELPQQLPTYQACWYVRNALGVPCHEVAISSRAERPVSTQRIAPLLRRKAPALPLFPEARDESTHNPHVQKNRISRLVESTAAALFSIGSRPHTRIRVLHVEQDQPSTQEAA